MKTLLQRLLAAALVPLAAAAGAAEPRLNQIQVIGTHNSYSQPADPRVFQVMSPRLQPMLDAMMQRMPEDMRRKMEDEHPNPLAANLEGALEYRFPSLDTQLRAGLRSLELDLNVDHDGGRFLAPLSYRLLRAGGEKDLAPLHTDALREPGLKVLHMADVDFRSSCPTFRICLRQLREWSDDNPGHTPVFILLEPKFSNLAAALPDATQVAPFDARAFDEMEAALGEIIGRERLIVPDQVRGGHATLEAGALAGNWPTLSQARGKFVFLMIVPGLNMATFAPYLEGHPSLEGRLAFVQGEPGMPHAAFLMIDNAITQASRIPELVRKGYLVRSRADIDTGEARKNDVRRRDAALASGAQIISTDYPFAPNIFGNAYEVKPFAESWRANPVNGK